MDDKQIVIERVFSCSKDELFNIWNKPEFIEKWYGPEGFNTKVNEYNFKEGGKWKFTMVNSENNEYPVFGVFKFIDSPDKVVSTDGWEDEGNVSGMVLTAEFEEIDKTQAKLILTSAHKTVEDKEKFIQMGVPEAWEMSFKKIDSLIS